MAPADPLRLQVMNRVKTVLQAIQSGSEYFYTPHEVILGRKNPEKLTGCPTYMIWPEKGSVRSNEIGHVHHETLPIIIWGKTKSNDDLLTTNERAVRDVRKAISEDMKLKTAGTLGALAYQMETKESPITDYDYEHKEAYFLLRIEFTFSGDFGVL